MMSDSKSESSKPNGAKPRRAKPARGRDAAVVLDGLVKRFGPITAVDGVSFEVGSGEVLGFLGPNGAGKSTTMKMLTCFLTPTHGTASVCGYDILNKSREVRTKIGYLPEGAPAYPDMTPASFLKFVSEIRGLSGQKQRTAIDRAVQAAALEDVYHQPIETLSKGFKRRVGLAQAILHDPPVLILDEPTDGLDPNQKHEVRELIRRMAEGKVIILSTHILEEVEAVCSRAIIIARGKTIFDGTPEALQKKSARHNAVTVTVDKAKVAEVTKDLQSLKDVQTVTEEPAHNGHVTLLATPRHGKPILADVTKLARGKDWALHDMRAETGRLDEVFRDLTLGRGEAPKKAAAKNSGTDKANSDKANGDKANSDKAGSGKEEKE
ncbi:MAG: ABC transporter ATP-binding protein [Sumerlaeia bacterium]